MHLRHYIFFLIASFNRFACHCVSIVVGPTTLNAFSCQVSNIERLRESFAKASSETHAGSKMRQPKMLNMKMILAGMIL